MKRIVSILIILSMLCITTFAIGDPNIGGEDGDDLNEGTGQNYWSAGDDGVRITVVEESTNKAVSKSVDFANKEQKVDYFWGYRNKIYYVSTRNPIKREFGTNYKNIVPNSKLPFIISDGGINNVEAVKRHFSDEGVLIDVCTKLNFSYDELINGKYVLLIEPLVYMTYGGYK